MPMLCIALSISSCSLRYRFVDSFIKRWPEGVNNWQGKDKDSLSTFCREMSSSRILIWERKLASASSKVPCDSVSEHEFEQN
jgi:hypothetical protein